jgi:hypothetical protein
MEISFDIDQIVKITFTKSAKTNLIWLKARPTKSSFWPWKRKSAKEEGFYEHGDYDYSRYSRDAAIKSFIVECEDDGYICLYKPRVDVMLKNKETLSNILDDDKFAIEWVNMLKQLSGKNFETIIR